MSRARMRLGVSNPQQLDWAIRHAEEVTELFVDAKLVREAGYRTVLSGLSGFPDLEKVWIEDDYLNDSEMREIRSLMKSNFPRVVLAWMPGAYVDGKHGR